MRRIVLFGSFALALSAQDKATYIPAEEIQAYLKRVPEAAGAVSDQQVRAVNVGKSNVDIGVVYRGKQSPAFYGVYICADYTSKRIWGITQKDRIVQTIRQIALCPQSVSSFGIDEAGEIYAVGYDGGTIYHLDLTHCQFNARTK